MTGATIGPITGITLATADLRAAEDAYARYLGFRVGGRGRIAAAEAKAWNRPAAAGAACVSMHPQAADDFRMRFVEVPGTAGYRAFSSFGWNAAELIVADVDAMADELAGSPFEILGPPQDLSFTDAIRAMQVRGPAGEILYLTQFKRSLPTLPAPPVRGMVDRVFIVIVGGPSLDDLTGFYTATFGVSPPQRMESPVKAMSEVFGLSPEHRFRIAALPLQGMCYIEADQMPPAASEPVVAPGQLPPGIAVVTFGCRGPARPGFFTGAAGEMIELVAL